MLLSLPSPLKAVWKKSWTKLWGYLQIGGAAIVGGISELSNFVSNDTFKSYLNMMDVPKWVLVGIAALGLMTWLAHGREDA